MIPVPPLGQAGESSPHRVTMQASASIRPPGRVTPSAISEAAIIASPSDLISIVPPMPVVDGATATAPDGSAFRLDRDDLFGWILSRDAGDGWQRQYSFTLNPVWESDLLMGNHWCSTAPASRFTSSRIVSVVLPKGYASLNGADYRRRSGGEETRAEITDPRVYRLRLSMLFGIDLSADEVAALGVFAGG